MNTGQLVYEFMQELELLAIEFGWRVCIYRQPIGCGWNVYFRRKADDNNAPFEYCMLDSAIFFDKHPEELKEIIQNARKQLEERK